MQSTKKKVKSLGNIFIFFIMCLMLLLWCASVFSTSFIDLSSSSQLENIIEIGTIFGMLGGFYLGIGLLLVAYFMRGILYLKATIVLMSVFLIHTFIRIANHGFKPHLIIAICIIITTLTIFLWLIKKHPTPKNYIDEVHPDFKNSRFMSGNFKSPQRKKFINKYLEKMYEKANVADNIEIKKHEIEGYDGRQIKVEVFQQKDATDDTPCMIVYPGGAFWAKPIPTYKYFFNRYINGTGMKIVFVHYTLSLEAPYPAAVEDCYLATLWTYENARQIGVNKDKIALYGISTGGTLVGSVTQMLRDRKQFKPCFQLLIYPMVDSKMNTRSAIKYKEMPIWKDDVFKDFLDFYLKNENPKKYSPYAFPTLAKDFSNLPNAYIEVAQYDALRDEGEIYAKKLRKNHVQVQFYEVKGAVHGFDIALKSEITKAVFQRRIDILNKVFNEIE